jgi:renalase
MPRPSQNIAIIGAGMAGVVCARTLVQAGHRVSLFDAGQGAGGRMASYASPFGTFDHGTQYFTQRDARFAQALALHPQLCRPWSVSTVRVLDALGRVLEAAPSRPENHWVASPCMNDLLRQWVLPLEQAGQTHWQTSVERLAPDALAAERWQLHASGPDGAHYVFSGFDAVLLATPSAQARRLLKDTGLAAAQEQQLAQVQVAPCWTLMLAFPQAVQPGLPHLGPQWNAARSTHHRVAWLAREGSKPQRGTVERWTVQASPAWSQEHLEDEPARVLAKLRKAFTEITGIHAEPAFAEVHRWREAQTLQALGHHFVWDGRKQLGACGDWCLGDRVEDAFVSGLELALHLA